MKSANREASVFSTSAIDLFASALGSFILLVLILFPFYNRAGSDSEELDFEELIGNRRTAEAELSEIVIQTKTLEDQLANLQEQYQSSAKRVEEIKSEIENRESAAIELVNEEKLGLDEEPIAVADGVDFSILGLDTRAKSFVVVIDMSSSMQQYEDLVRRTLAEILNAFDDKRTFAVMGYSSPSSGRRIVRYPEKGGLVQGTKANLREATRYVERMIANFEGSTPTNYALQQAIQYDVESIILLSDGRPDNDDWQEIVRDVKSANRRKEIEINTVALGDYLGAKELVRFLHAIAQTNRGDFVGVSE